MNHALLEAKFARIGARVRATANRRRGLTLDVVHDARGECFVVDLPRDGGIPLEVVDLRPDRRHLLLLARENGAKSKFLCGHDERHWFVAAVPEKVRGVRDVETAMEALKPPLARSSQRRRGVKRKHRQSRRNAGFGRQGEWFFVPAPGFAPDPLQVFRNEPLLRSDGSKPHTMEFCVRRGGERVYVNWRYPAGVREAEYRRLRARPENRRMRWQVLARNPQVFAKGAIRHADHATIHLADWHRVVMNREPEAVAMRHVVFLD